MKASRGSSGDCVTASAENAAAGVTEEALEAVLGGICSEGVRDAELLIASDGAFDPAGLEVEGTSLVCVVAWLLPGFAGAFGGAVVRGGGAAEAAPPVGASVVCLGMLGVVQGIAEIRSGADPPRTTSAYDVFPANCGKVVGKLSSAALGAVSERLTLKAAPRVGCKIWRHASLQQDAEVVGALFAREIQDPFSKHLGVNLASTNVDVAPEGGRNFPVNSGSWCRYAPNAYLCRCPSRGESNGSSLHGRGGSFT
ncbi:hypothetical protein HPB51_007351 [Rhipicephalus microplus]|uniref:Uncharacterized protein n=1 Tax=Rhipicephalus microplus TaxID=6941 RepID=A0A9J6DFE5_RHIMP|nr:hypothetical protein HPB51_007351 [Rhipicephalus microplus]